MKQTILLMLVFSILLCCMIWPLPHYFTTHIPGSFFTDESYSVLSNGWYIAKTSFLGAIFDKPVYWAYPFGYESLARQPFGYIFFLINYVLAHLTSPILTYNIQLVVNYLLSAFFMFLLVYFITRNRLASYLSALIYSFSPYMFVRSWQHLGETYIWCIPLFMWSLFKFAQNSSLRMKFLFLAAVVISTVNWDMTYYNFVALGIFILFVFTQGKYRAMLIPRLAFILPLTFLVVMPQFFIFIMHVFKKGGIPSAQNIFHRPFEDLFMQSARPLSYLLPSVAHPLFGKFTEQLVGTPWYGISFTEHTLFLGWTPLILAFVAARRTVLSKTRVGDTKIFGVNFYVRFFIVLALGAWLFSQPPWWQIGSIRIYMPSFFTYKIIPSFRAYCRFGIVVMASVAVLAGVGMIYLLERFKTRSMKFVAVAVCFGLVLFEFWTWPPYKVIDVSEVPAVYYWLKGQPENVVIAEYPLDINGSNELYKLYQTKHEKKMVNATITGTYANSIAKTIARLSEPRTAGVLKWMSVKYVLVHKADYLKTGLIDDAQELNKIPGNPGLKLINAFPAEGCRDQNIRCIEETGPIDVYEVAAVAIKPQLMEK